MVLARCRKNSVASALPASGEAMFGVAAPSSPAKMRDVGFSGIVCSGSTTPAGGSLQRCCEDPGSENAFSGVIPPDPPRRLSAQDDSSSVQTGRRGDGAHGG